MSVIDQRFVATRELFELCRSRVTVDDLKDFAPNDPGYLNYVAAFENILVRGEGALRLEFDFDVDETIGLTRWVHAPSPRFRWFRALTVAVDLLRERSESPHYGIAALLVDFGALGDTPANLLATICREVDAGGDGLGQNERIFCSLALLLLDEGALDVRCDELTAREARQRAPSVFDPVASTEFFWGLTYFDQLHSVWLDLVDARFPTTTPTARALKHRLLSEGARWRNTERAFS